MCFSLSKLSKAKDLITQTQQGQAGTEEAFSGKERTGGGGSPISCPSQAWGNTTWWQQPGGKNYFKSIFKLLQIWFKIFNKSLFRMSLQGNRVCSSQSYKGGRCVTDVTPPRVQIDLKCPSDGRMNRRCPECEASFIMFFKWREDRCQHCCLQGSSLWCIYE